MKILSIETSCDETSAAVIEGRGDNVKILSNIVSSQIDIHKKYGGVVPEVAARNHILNIIPVIDEALEAGVKFSNPPLIPPCKGGRLKSIPYYKEIDLIAVASGPGLMSSLLIGTQTAETLAYVWNKPLISINHIEGHIYANWLTSPSPSLARRGKPKFPVLALVVSGGHTQLVLMRGHLKYKTIGQTRDDAAGEAFDKVAKILGLGYPGGPIISKMAELESPRPPFSKGEPAKYSSPFEKGGQGDFLNNIKLPRPMINNKDFDFSFSGLKTAVLYLVKDLKKNVSDDKFKKEIVPQVCKEFQQAAIDVLVHKTIKAAEKYRVKNILLAGGVAANKELKRQLKARVEDELNLPFFVPEQKLCTDNAAMIGSAAYYRYRTNPQRLKKAPVQIKVDPNWVL